MAVAAYLEDDYVEEYIALIKNEFPKITAEERRRIGLNWFNALGHVPMHDSRQRRLYSKVLGVIDELRAGDRDQEAR